MVLMKLFRIVIYTLFLSSSVVSYADDLDTALYHELQEDYDYSDQEPPEKPFEKPEQHTPDYTPSAAQEPEEELSWLGKSQVLTYVLTAIGLVVLIIVIVRIQGKMDNKRVAKLKAATSLEEAEENLLEVHLDDLIKDASKAKDFRMMMHLQFLELLRALHHQDVLSWQPYKTNGQYALEIKDMNRRALYRKVTVTFDRVWYGHKPINETLYSSWFEWVTELRRDEK